jgi:hypothetical protein
MSCEDKNYVAGWLAGRLGDGRSLREALLEFDLALPANSEPTVAEAVRLIESRVRTLQETDLVSELVHASQTGDELAVAALLAAGVRWDAADCKGEPTTRPQPRTATPPPYDSPFPT